MASSDLTTGRPSLARASGYPEGGGGRGSLPTNKGEDHMATLAEIRGRVRLRLEEGSAAVWTDEELDEAILAGLELYNGRFPMEATQSAAVNGTNVAMPAQARAVLRVTLADGT